MSFIREHQDMACDLNEEVRCTLTLIRELDLEVDNITSRCETRLGVLEKYKNVVTPEFSQEENKAIREQYSKAKEIADYKVELAERLEFLGNKYKERLDKDLQQCRNDLEAEREGLAARIEKRWSKSDKRHPRKKKNTDSHAKLPKLGEPSTSNSYEEIQTRSQAEKNNTEPTDSIKPKNRRKKKKTKPSYSKLVMSNDTSLSWSVTNDTLNPTVFEKSPSPFETAMPGSKLKPCQLGTSPMTGKVKPSAQPQTSGSREKKSCDKGTKTTASTQSQTNGQEKSKLPKQQTKASVFTQSQISSNKENKSSKQKKKPTESASKEKMKPTASAREQTKGKRGKWSPEEMKPTLCAKSQTSNNTENKCSKQQITAKNEPSEFSPAQITGKTYSSESKIKDKTVKEQAMGRKIVSAVTVKKDPYKYTGKRKPK